MKITLSRDLNFQLLEMSPEKTLSILKGSNSSKAAGIDNLSGKFLKDCRCFSMTNISTLQSFYQTQLLSKK